MSWPLSRLFVTVGLALAALGSTMAPASAAPAWWRVSDGHAEVWILGVARVVPAKLAWDTTSVQQRLAGASQLIVSVQPTGNLKAFTTLLGSARSPKPMLADLSPALRRRFEAASAAIGKDPARYAGWKPVVAGLFLAGDFYKANGLKSGGEIESAVRKLARKAGVREVPAGTYDAGEMAGAAGTLSPAGQQVCLAATLHGLELGPPRLRADAEAWAAGNPHPMIADASDTSCLDAMPPMKALTQRSLGLEAAAVAAALKAPGRSLAVFDLQQLSAAGGVLDRLRSRGLTVSGPLP